MIMHEGDGAMLLFVLARPDESQWSELLAGYARRIFPIAFNEESRVGEYPPALYIL